MLPNVSKKFNPQQTIYIPWIPGMGNVFFSLMVKPNFKIIYLFTLQQALLPQCKKCGYGVAHCYRNGSKWKTQCCLSQALCKMVKAVVAVCVLQFSSCLEKEESEN